MEKEFKGKSYEVGKGNWTIFPDLCKGCGLCIEKCPKKSLGWSDELGCYAAPTVKVDRATCNVCTLCAQICPDCAISVERR